jgi:hypothetical protein
MAVSAITGDARKQTAASGVQTSIEFCGVIMPLVLIRGSYSKPRGFDKSAANSRGSMPGLHPVAPPRGVAKHVPVIE